MRKNIEYLNAGDRRFIDGMEYAQFVLKEIEERESNEDKISANIIANVTKYHIETLDNEISNFIKDQLALLTEEEKAANKIEYDNQIHAFD